MNIQELIIFMLDKYLTVSQVLERAEAVENNNKVNAIIDILEKQIPRKPYGIYTDYRCPCCDTRVRSGKGSSSRTKDTVCRKCFQVLDWE